MFDVQDGGVEREPRAGFPRVPAYVHYTDVVPDSVHPCIGVDTIITTSDVEARVTNSFGQEVLRL